MKINDIITEASKFDLINPTTTRTMNSAEKIAAYLSTNCSDMVAAYKSTGLVLYRGMSSREPVVKSVVRKNRKPSEMNLDRHMYLNKLFLAAGITSTRSNSLFCSTSPGTASSWGSNVYILFMKNGWHGVTFMFNVDDYSYYELSSLALGGLQGRYDLNTAVEKLKALKPFMIKDQDSLKTVLNKRVVDLILSGTTYVGLNVDSEITSEVLQLLEIKIKK